MNKKERMVLSKELGISEVKIYKWLDIKNILKVNYDITRNAIRAIRNH